MTRRPQPPKHLSAAGKAVWKRLVDEIPDHNVGTLLSLEQLCFSWSRWLASRGDDSKLRWARASRQWLAELRLTPRTKTTRKPAEESGDPILKLIHRAAE